MRNQLCLRVSMKSLFFLKKWCFGIIIREHPVIGTRGPVYRRPPNIAGALRPDPRMYLRSALPRPKQDYQTTRMTVAGLDGLPRDYTGKSKYCKYVFLSSCWEYASLLGVHFPVLIFGVRFPVPRLGVRFPVPILGVRVHVIILGMEKMM